MNQKTKIDKLTRTIFYGDLGSCLHKTASAWKAAEDCGRVRPGVFFLCQSIAKLGTCIVLRVFGKLQILLNYLFTFSE